MINSLVFAPCRRAKCKQCGLTLVVTPEKYLTCPNYGHLGLIHPEGMLTEYIDRCFLVVTKMSDKVTFNDR